MKIFVGNLSFQSSDDSIRSLFEAHGKVDEVALITDRDTGRPRGFGFVNMPNDDEARAAIEAVNGQDVDGRTLNVNEAHDRGDRGGRGGGGGGGRGGGGRGGGGGGGGGRC